MGAAPAVAVVDVGAVRVALLVGEGVVLAVVGDPGDHRPLDRRRAEDRQHGACSQRLGLEGAVGEEAVEADRDPEPGEDVDAERRGQTSLQCSALPQTCQAAKPSARKGTTVTRPVMIRSRVSLATGWMHRQGQSGRQADESDRGRRPMRGASLSGNVRHEVSCGPGKRSTVDAQTYAGTVPALAAVVIRVSAPVPFGRCHRAAAPGDRARLPERPFTIEFWDGTKLPVHQRRRPDLHVRSLARRSPTRCGARASSASAAPTSRGEIEVDDIDAVIGCSTSWQPPPLDGADKARCCSRRRCAPPGCTAAAARPKAELRPRGRRHSKERDPAPSATTTTSATSSSRSSSDESMTYSCAIFSRGGAQTLEGGAGGEARARSHASSTLQRGRAGARRRLRLGRLPALGGDRARRRASVGITLSAPQAELARQRAEEAGVADRVEIRVQDYRDLAGESFDAIASIGMVEHVGAAQIDVYAEQLAAMLRAGRAPAQPRHHPPAPQPTPRPAPSPSATSSPTPRRCTSRGDPGAGAGRLRHPPRRGVRRRLRRDAAPLGPATSTTTSSEASELAGPERLRVWRLYLRAARNGFESGFTSVYQARCWPPDGALTSSGARCRAHSLPASLTGSIKPEMEIRRSPNRPAAFCSSTL